MGDGSWFDRAGRGPADGRIAPGLLVARPDVRFDHGPELNENSYHFRRESIMMVKQQSKKKKVWFVYLILGTVAAVGDPTSGPPRRRRQKRYPNRT